MRKFLASVLALAMTLSLTIPGASAKTGFADGGQISENSSEAVEVLSGIGILAGYENGDGSWSYHPRSTLTRGAGAKIVAYLVLGQAAADKLTAAYAAFPDVTDSVSLSPYIEWAAAAGIVDGYEDGRFRPYDQLTEYAFGKMLLTALGYLSEEEGFTGSGWQQNVRAVALACGVFDGTETYGLCDRETAARMAFGALQAPIVVYDRQRGGPGTQDPGVWTGACQTAETLAGRYGLVKTSGPDSWGRPGHYWSYGDWEEFFPDPVRASYQTAVAQCDAAEELGIDWRKSYITYTNGAGNVGTVEIAASQTVETIGAQGRLTEVYDDVIVYIDTFLGEVTEVEDRTYDPSGHLRTPASMTVAVYGAESGGSALTFTRASTTADFPYSAGDRLAVHRLTDADGTERSGEAYSYEVAGALSSVTVTVDAIVTDAGGSSSAALISGGVRYDYNHTFAGTRLSAGDIGSEWTLYLDEQGNVLALESADGGGPSGFGVVTAVDTERLGVGRYLAVAEVLRADGTAAVIRFEDSEKNLPFASQGEAELAAIEIGAGVLLCYEDTDGDGYCDFWAKGSADGAETVYRGRADTLDGALVNDDTVFFVANYSFDYARDAYVFGGYSIIRGFKNIKELTNTPGLFEDGGKDRIEVSTLAGSNAVLVLYANRQSTPAAQPVDRYAYLITDRFVTIGSGYKTYNAIIDGVSGQSLRVTEGAGAQIGGTGLYVYDENAADVNGWDEVTALNRSIAAGSYRYESGVLAYGERQYLTVADGAAVYIINPLSGRSVRGSLADLDADMYGTVCDIEYQLDENGYVSLIYIVENADSYAPETDVGFQ